MFLSRAFFASARRRGKNFLPFEQAREYVRREKLQNKVEWRSWCMSEKRPLCIPANPSFFYKDSGYESLADWLGYCPDRAESRRRKWREYLNEDHRERITNEEISGSCTQKFIEKVTAGSQGRVKCSLLTQHSQATLLYRFDDDQQGANPKKTDVAASAYSISSQCGEQEIYLSQKNDRKYGSWSCILQL